MLTIVQADLVHCEAVWRINNHPKVRAASFSGASIAFSEHVEWYERSIEDANRLLFVGLEENEVLSVVRFDRISPTEAEISLAVEPRFHGRGLGKLSIDLGSLACFELWPDIRAVMARVKEANLASRKAFESVGYKLSRDDLENLGKTLSFMLNRPT